MSSVFITDGHWRKTLAAVRSLGRAGIQVTAGEATRLATALFSRYCTSRTAYPSPIFDQQTFSAWLLDFVKNKKFDVIIPMEDETTEIFLRLEKELAPHTHVLLPRPDLFQLARDKGSFYEYCQMQGWPIPRTFRYAELPASFTTPIIMKPRIGGGSRGIQTFRCRAKLETFLQTYAGSPEDLTFQEIVEGIGYGLTALLDRDSQVKASFVHKRLREYPISGGPSTLRVGVHHEKLRELGLTILNSLGWQGLAMLEFKVNEKTGDIYLIELNPRYPGSLALAVASGVDFPLLHYKLALGENIPTVWNYRVGIQCRWLLPGDIFHFLQNPHRFHMQPSFFKFTDERLYYDIISCDDPMPTIGRLLAPLSLLLDRGLRIKSRKKMPKTARRHNERTH